MWVNMYVTGLLCFYAGQIAHKLVDDIAHTDPSELITQARPAVQVTFAGKGSRLLQWLTTTQPQVARQYYETLFMQGFGGMPKMQELLSGCRIVLPDGTAADIKYEVSKGLAKAQTDLYRPRKEAANSEIIGETGFAILQRDGKEVPVPDTNTITPEMVQNIGVYFSPVANDPYKRFMEFCSTFYGAAKQMYGLDIPRHNFKNGFQSLNIVQYVQNLPEFKEAKNAVRQNQGIFDFVAPIIIFEGMTFLENTLLPSL